MIHFRPVMLLTISFVSMQMVSQRRFITSSSELNTSFLNPIERICFQICSMGFISGVYGGMERSCMFSGHFNPALRMPMWKRFGEFPQHFRCAWATSSSWSRTSMHVPVEESKSKTKDRCCTHWAFFAPDCTHFAPKCTQCKTKGLLQNDSRELY